MRLTHNSCISVRHSYANLITLAINSSHKRKMTLAEIYQWIMDNFTYYRQASSGWKVSSTISSCPKEIRAIRITILLPHTIVLSPFLVHNSCFRRAITSSWPHKQTTTSSNQVTINFHFVFLWLVISLQGCSSYWIFVTGIMELAKDGGKGETDVWTVTNVFRRILSVITCPSTSASRKSPALRTTQGRAPTGLLTLRTSLTTLTRRKSSHVLGSVEDL